MKREGRTKQLPFVIRSGGDPPFPRPGDTAALIDGRTARLERVDCRLCGAADEEPLIAVKDWGYGLTRENFVIVRCRRCGLAWLNPRPAKEDIGLFYPGVYYERRQTTDQGSPPPARRLSREALAEEASLCGPPPPGGAARLLDVGCASGLFLSHMRTLGWHVQGVEVSLEAAEWGARELDLDIINKPLTEAGLPAASCDVITFWSALEHVHEPLACLAEARRLLKPGGRAVILIPNLASPTVRRLHWGLDPPRHLYHFTPQTLRRARRAAGFDGAIRVTSRTSIEDGSFHRQVAKIGRRLYRYALSPEASGMGRPAAAAGAAAGWALARFSFLLAPVSWALTAAGRNGPMIVTAFAGPDREARAAAAGY